MVALDDNIEWYYDGISESERVEIIGQVLGDMDIRIRAHLDNQAKKIFLKIAHDKKYGAPGYDIAPYNDVSHVVFEGIEALTEKGYLVESYLDSDCHVVRKEGLPFFRFMKSNDLSAFLYD
jgi:hypothetical protein